MDRIFNIPKYLSNRSSIDECWIETNDANVGMSEIKFDDMHCWVPWHIYEDSLIDDDIINEHAIEKDYWTLYPIHLYSEIQRIRGESYKACNWYEDIINNIPTSKSIISKINDEYNRDYEIQKVLEENLEKYPFVRLCTMSAKDVKCVPIYEKWEDALKDLNCSERTKRGCHIFMREKREYTTEARCFWSRDKLRAVSLALLDTDIDEIENKKIESSITYFFKRYGKYIPYHSAVVDIGIISSDPKGLRIELIEFNSFGPDMNATAGNFSWYEDSFGT